MLSMTGFGAGEARIAAGRLLLELRALNHRYLDVRVRLPSELMDHAFFLEQLARTSLSRGRFDIGVRFEPSEAGSVALDLERARSVYEALCRLRDTLAPESEVPIAALLGLPDLFRPPVAADPAGARKALAEALALAMLALSEMRKSEGAVLRAELEKRLRAARAALQAMLERASELVEVYRARLQKRVERLLGDARVPLERGRLETELAILADRSDVTEELVRLASHFDQFERFVENDGPIGRQLDFLLQEMGREANTVGSKAQDSGLTHLVVEMKTELDRMREQVQNVE